MWFVDITINKQLKNCNNLKKSKTSSMILIGIVSIYIKNSFLSHNIYIPYTINNISNIS